MKTAPLTPQAEAITDAIFAIFRTHGDLIAFGDRMVGEFGLTSARWQVLGTIVLGDADTTVPRIARTLGLSRQAVQRVANDLESAELVRFVDNPHHKRARLVQLTEAGERAYRAADARFAAWANEACAGFTVDEIRNAVAVMQRLDRLCTAYPDAPALEEVTER